MSKQIISKNDFNEIINECTLLKVFASRDYGDQLNLLSILCDERAEKYSREYEADKSKEYLNRLSERYKEYGKKIYYFLDAKGYYNDVK